MERNKDVDKYITSLPTGCADVLEKMRDNIFDILIDVPEMTENYSYQIAVYKYGRKPLFSIAGFKGHCSLITQDKEIRQKIPDLANFEISGTTIHFTAEKPITKDLLGKIIESRLASRKSELND